MANHFWRDGGTRKVFIQGVDRLYDDLRLTIRTTTNTEIEASDQELQAMHGANEDALRRKQSEFICAQIKAWDAADNGAVAPVTPENLRCLQPVLYKRVCAIAYGSDGGDPDPRDEQGGAEKTATHEEQEGNSAAA